VPPLPSVPDVIKIAMRGHMSGGYNWANVFHMAYGPTPPAENDCQTIAAHVEAQWVANFQPVCPSATHLDEVVVTDLSSPTAAEYTLLTTDSGTSSFNPIPANATALVSKLIQARYRGGHPRSYLAIGGDGHLADGAHWNSAFVNTYKTAWQTMIENLIAGSPYGSTDLALECAVSYYTTDYTFTPPKRVRRVTPVVYDIPVDGYTGHAEIASQRRRIGRKR
jgi:hypothetical protein